MAKFIFWHHWFSARRLQQPADSEAGEEEGGARGGLLPLGGNAGAGGCSTRAAPRLQLATLQGAADRRGGSGGGGRGGAVEDEARVCVGHVGDKAAYHSEVGWQLLLTSRDYDAEVHLAVALDLCPAAAGMPGRSGFLGGHRRVRASWCIYCLLERVSWWDLQASAPFISRLPAALPACLPPARSPHEPPSRPC